MPFTPSPRRLLRFFAPAFVPLCVLWINPSAGASVPAVSPAAAPELATLPLRSLGELLDLAAANESPAVVEVRRVLVGKARADAALPIIRRVHSIEEIKASRIPLKDTVANRAPEQQETFALAMFDNGAGGQFSNELPRLAAAYRLTDETLFRDRIFAQLTEIATWDPLLRPGWGGGDDAALGDGVWLGTGWHIRGITEALDMIPPGEVPPGVRAAIDALLDREIATILTARKARRSWFFKTSAAHSNQWVLPVEALVLATIHRGALRDDASPSLREAYERGVEMLAMSLDAQGAEGEFREGLTYAAITLRGLLSAGRAMARAGDLRAIRHPFLANAGTWFAHHIQPGGFLVNTFDTLNGARGQLPIFANIYAQLVVATGNPHALWVRDTYGLGGDEIDALVAATLPASLALTPPLHAAYAVAPRVVWRSSWDDDTASGVWIRGGDVSDAHDHQDRGHVNFIVGRRPLLIEAGALSYATPGFATRFKGVPGHNVLQVGDIPASEITVEQLATAGQILTAAHRPAPITVHRLDDKGGDVTVDVSRAYARATRWIRRVEWTATRLRVHDEVTLAEPDIALFRWHTGEAPGAVVRQLDSGLEIGGVRIAWESSAPVVSRVESSPDATLRARAISEHATAIVRSREPVTTFTLTTTVEPVSPDEAPSATP